MIREHLTNHRLCILCDRLFNDGDIKLFRVDQGFLSTLWAEEREVF